MQSEVEMDCLRKQGVYAEGMGMRPGLSCRICGDGPCRARPPIWQIPNRLLGSRVLSSGDAT